MKALSAFWLLAGWLIAGAAAWAQPMANATGFVDSPEECTALGGAWLGNRGTWKAACQVPWERQDCLRLGGAWTPMGAAPAGGLCVAQVSVQATARQCADAGGTWGPPGSSMPFCEPGTAQAAAPVRVASDANRACSSQGDCSYGCVYRGPPLATGAQVMGQCRPTSQVRGCYAMVENGRLAGSICMK
jgi:hypothetical protein